MRLGRFRGVSFTGDRLAAGEGMTCYFALLIWRNRHLFVTLYMVACHHSSLDCHGISSNEFFRR